MYTIRHICLIVYIHFLNKNPASFPAGLVSVLVCGNRSAQLFDRFLGRIRTVVAVEEPSIDFVLGQVDFHDSTPEVVEVGQSSVENFLRFLGRHGLRVEP